MTGHGLGEDGFVRPAAYNTGAAQLWTPRKQGFSSPPRVPSGQHLQHLLILLRRVGVQGWEGAEP